MSSNENTASKFKLKITPQMKLSIKVLRFSLIQLREYIKQQQETNPLLELLEIEDIKNRLRTHPLTPIPDVTLQKEQQKYRIIFNNWGGGQLKLNEKYREIIEQKDTPLNNKKYLQKKLKAANALIEAIKKRKETLQKVIKEIICAQKDFFDKKKGDLKALTLKQIAVNIGKNKSTVSRAINNKYLQTPYGIFELRHFLNRGIKAKNGEFFSTKEIKTKIEKLIVNEKRQSPLSDQKIAGYLKKAGICISRRTIAKYRKELKIPCSNLRKK